MASGGVGNFNAMGLPMSYSSAPSSYMFQGFTDPSSTFGAQSQGSMASSFIKEVQPQPHLFIPSLGPRRIEGTYGCRCGGVLSVHERCLVFVRESCAYSFQGSNSAMGSSGQSSGVGATAMTLSGAASSSWATNQLRGAMGSAAASPSAAAAAAAALSPSSFTHGLAHARGASQHFPTPVYSWY
ncbi:hypothetical protein Avbf_09371 [Armadillidium vulgare]|nr:hypothetical protein Avbf_09371 [Armadillidium vulgare]